MRTPDQQLKQVERELGVRFPDDVRVFLLAGGAPEPGGHWYQYWQGTNAVSSWIEAFRVLAPRDASDLGLTQIGAERRQEWPAGMASIGIGPGGQEILVACGPHDRGSVWMKDFPSCSELNSPSEHLYFIAPSFSSFLSQLSNPEALRPPFPPRIATTPKKRPHGLAPLPSFTNHLRLIEPLAQGYDLVEERWRDEYIRREWCSGCAVIREDADFTTPVQLRRAPRRLFSGAKPFLALHESILRLLQPFLEGTVVRPVTIAGTPTLEWSCLHYKPRAWLECDRGRFAQHRQCPSCGAVSREAMNAHPVVLARDLDHRQLYLSQFNELFMTAPALEQSGLERALPGVKVHAVPIVEHSLSAEILPGDVGWNGRLRVVRPPAVPADLQPTSYRRFL